MSPQRAAHIALDRQTREHIASAEAAAKAAEDARRLAEQLRRQR